MSAAALMFQGTGSDVGKSLLVAGLCRAYVRRGLKVLPFKPQNMSNNAAVTPDGGEIGRAQALQARACGVDLSVHMNPVLLKPQTDIGSQVVVQGQVIGNCKAREYAALKPTLMPKVMESFNHLREQADLVLIEGAGSAAEVNLRKGDIANMGFAKAVDVPVILIGDIDRGGVIASLVGTHVLLPDDERELIKGYVINKFRGDVNLFHSAVDLIEERAALKSFGIVPFFPKARLLPAEDAMALDLRGADEAKKGLKIVVPRLPRIANFDDLDPLRAEADVEVIMVEAGNPLPLDADLIILAGSKATLSDFDDLVANGWDIDIKAHVRRGGHVLGICGGYQILGKTLSDPDGIEGDPRSLDGLGLLDVETVLKGPKTLQEVQGNFTLHDECSVRGYEMHMGVTEGPDCQRPWLNLDGNREGARSADDLVWGSYVHELFVSDAFRSAFLGRIRQGRTSDLSYDQQIETILDELADHMEKYVDLDQLLALAKAGG